MDHTENLYKNIDKKRWIGLISSLLVMITISYSYTWSLMVNPMIEERGASLSSMALLYTILNIGYSFLMMVGGKISDKIGVRKMFIIAVVCYAIGFALCGLWTTFWGFTIGTLVFINIQNGFGYIAAFSCVGRLFPDKKGLCMALIGMGTTGGGMVISPVTQYFIDTIGFSGQFLAMGAILTVIGVIAVILCVPAPDGYVPAGYSFEDEEKKQEEGITLNQKFVQKDWKMMIKDPAFYLFALSTIFGSIGGMILMFQMSWVAQDIINVTAAQAAFLVSATTGVNALGKVFWGAVSDKVGRLNLLPIMLAIETLAFIVLAFLSEGAAIVFIVCSLIAVFCYAGQVAFGGPLTSDLFGSKNFGFNFSILLWAPTAATAISPWLAAAGKGTFFMFGICALSCILSITCALLLRKLRKDNLEVVYKIKN